MTNGEKFIHDNLTSIPYFVDNKVLLNMEFDAEWWNAEYKEPTDDLSSPLEKNSKLEKGTTKNDLGVDCIDRQATLDAIIKRLGIKNETYLLEAERAIYQQILAMPSVTPQEPTTKNDLGVDAVSRQSINGYIDYILTHGMGKKKSFDFIKKFVANLPTATPIRPKGHWIWCGGSHKCSNCEEYTCFSHKVRYCPNCGADMRGEE